MEITHSKLGNQIVYKYIRLDDLVGNALIVLLEEKRVGKITLPQLCDYGNALVRKFEIERNEKYVAVFSRYQRDAFLYDCSNYCHYELDSNSGVETIVLNENVNIDDLKNFFWATATKEWVKIFTDVAKEVVLGEKTA